MEIAGLNTHRLSLRCSVIMLALLATAAGGAVAPIDVSALSGYTRIRRLDFRPIAVPSLRYSGAHGAASAMGRTCEQVSVAEIQAAVNLAEESGTTTEIETRRGDYFDVWKAFSGIALEKDPRAARLSFEVVGATGGAVYLLFGANDGCAVFVDGRAVWGMVGSREHIEAENAVRIPVKNGAAKVDVICWKAKDWTAVPEDHHEDEWSVNLGLCVSEDEAWRSFTDKASHFLDSPIAPTIGDLRTTLWLGDHAQVEFYDLAGRLVGSGRALPTGRIELGQPIEALDRGFIGVAVLGGSFAEAIVLTGSRPLDELMEPCLAESRRTVPSWTAWEYRCRHLFKPEFLKLRDRWWARKAALTMAVAGLRAELSRERTPFREWVSAWMEFGDYTSKIDGTQQYYRAFVGSDGGGTRARPLVVLLPGVPMPVRPFLDSYTVADLKGAEELASLARETGCDVLWPGVVDIDYGGNLARVWAKEAVDAFARRHPSNEPRSIYVVGACSAGSGVLGYAETFGEINGLVLWSPVVDRPLYRWPFKDAGQWPLLTKSVMGPESSAANLRALRPIPLFVLFDHDEPGHGDRPGTAALCRELVSIGGMVDEEWVDKPDHRMMWGMRAVASERRWMRWIADQASNPVRLTDQRRNGSLNGDTVKNALLRGFILVPSPEPVALAWAQRWSDMLGLYRGVAPEASRQQETATRVEVRAVTGDQFNIELRRGFGSGRPQLPASAQLAEAASSYSALFAIRLALGSPDRVEVWCDSRGGLENVPAVDLFREGCCQAALWGLRAGRWELVQVWQ